MVTNSLINPMCVEGFSILLLLLLLLPLLLLLLRLLLLLLPPHAFVQPGLRLRRSPWT